MNYKLFQKLTDLYNDVLPIEDEINEIVRLVLDNYKRCSYCNQIFEGDGEYCSELCKEKAGD